MLDDATTHADEFEGAVCPESWWALVLRGQRITDNEARD
jgi:hypothetical protein